jgi:hypothetical protein
VSEDAGIEPRTVAITALVVRRSNHSARSHPHTRLDLIHWNIPAPYFLSTFLTVSARKNKDFDWSGRGPGHGRDPEDLRRVAVQGRALQDPPPLGAGHRRTGRPGDAREVRHQQRSVVGILFLGWKNASYLPEKSGLLFAPIP